MKKITIITILLIILISSFYNSFAFEIGNKELVSLGECYPLLRYQNKDRVVEYVVYRKNGKEYPAYCLQPALVGVGTHGTPGYTVSGTSRLEDEKIWRVLINGYPYKSLEELGLKTVDEGYTATKFALYTVIENRNVKDYAPVETEGAPRTYQAYLNILKNAKNSTEKLKDNNKLIIISEKDKWEKDEKDKNYVSKIYKVDSIIKNGTYSINITGDITNGAKITDLNNNEKNKFNLGEKFKILLPTKELKANNKFIINALSTLETKPIVYGKTSIEGTQDYAICGYMTEDCKGSLEESYPKNITKIRIIKKEYGTENRLEGVKFSLLNSNKEIIQKELITDENGEIILENVLPDKYYIQENQTLEGYNLYKDLIEIDIKFNEEVEIVINNTLKTVETIENNKDIIEIVPQYEEKMYNDKITKEIKKLPVTGY